MDVVNEVEKVGGGGEEIVETTYGDVWFVIGIRGELIPMYTSAEAEYAAIAAFVRGDYGSLLSDEIAFMREAGLQPVS